MPAGKVRSWIAEKGFGFIQPSDHGEELFVHFSDLASGDGSISEGDYVLYVIKYDQRKDKERAAEVEVTNYLRAGYDAEHSPIPERFAPGGGGGGGGGGKGEGGKGAVIREKPPPDAQEKAREQGGNFPQNSAKEGNQKGAMTAWNREKNFGFIKPDDGGEDLFAHVSSLVQGDGSCKAGDRVTYTKEWNSVKNKYLALNVRRDNNPPPKDKEKAADKGKGSDKRGSDDKRDAGRDNKGGRDRDRGRRDDDRDKERGRGKSRDRGRDRDRDKDKDRRRSKSKSRSRSRSRDRRKK